MRMRSVCHGLTLLIAFGLTGCGGANLDDQPELGQVTGKITLEDQPLAGALVTFVPESGRPATGKTNKEGVYELTYIRETMGCKTGRNKVMFTVVSEEEDTEEMEGDDFDQSRPKAKAATKELPARYNTKTELFADVQPGPNTFDYQLKKK